MKKIDKLVLDAFIGPFIITFLVVIFILLNINMLKYFDDIVGKGLEWGVIGQMFFYFAIITIPTSMPLAVLLSSLIAFGNLGEHFELTAIKSSGISLVRTMRAIFIFVLILTGIAFWANNNLVPRAALEAYSLLYDIKRKSPAMELLEGTFYDGIPGISIKVDKRYPDGHTFKNIVIYDHRKNDGNKEVTVADSGKMYTILNEQYMKMELFNGYNYTEGAGNEREITGQRGSGNETLTRSKFYKTQTVFDLSALQFGRTDTKLFQGNRIMRNLSELDGDIDSLEAQVMQQRLSFYQYRPSYFSYFGKKDALVIPKEVTAFQRTRDSLNQVKYQQQSRAKYIQDSVSNALAAVKAKRATDSLAAIAAKKDTVHSPQSTVHGNATAETKPADVKPAPAVNPNTIPAPRPAIALQKSKAMEKKKVKPPMVKPPRKKKTTVQPPVIKPVVVAAKPKKPQLSDSARIAKLDSIFARPLDAQSAQSMANMARQVKSQVENMNGQTESFGADLRIYVIQWHKIFASSLACVAMFLIGAPLGAIIKRGGLGMPFLISILFFIIYYVLTMQGEKLAKQPGFDIPTFIYGPDAVLLGVGMFFLRQARIDARLFEMDFYSVLLERFKRWRTTRRSSQTQPSAGSL
jgi:lipopolysaccharide export system permease protein